MAPAIGSMKMSMMPPRLLARLFYDDVVWALAGWFVQYDLTIFLRAGEAVLDLQRLIRVIPKPVIAVVAGYAIGGGNVLATVCDLTIAAENASVR